MKTSDYEKMVARIVEQTLTEAGVAMARMYATDSDYASGYHTMSVSVVLQPVGHTSGNITVSEKP